MAGPYICPVRRPVLLAAVVVIAALVGACGDDDAPPGAGAAVSEASGFSQIAPPRSASSEEAGTARQLAQALADGIVQSADGKVSDDDAACLVRELVARVSASSLARISASGPDPRALPAPLRQAMVDTFDTCLPKDIAKQLATRFDATGG